MTPYKLIVKGINGNDGEYVFDNADNVSGTFAEDFKQMLSYAIYGNDALYEGSITLEFLNGNVWYKLIRDFNANDVSLYIDDKKIDEPELTLSKIFPLTKKQWSALASVNASNVYDETTSDVKGFLSNVFSSYGIDEKFLMDARNAYDDKISILTHKIEALDGVKTCSIENATAEIDALTQKLAEREKDRQTAINTIQIGVESERIRKNLSEVRSELTKINAQSEVFAEMKERIERSEQLKRQLEWEKTISVIKKEIDTLEKEISVQNEELLNKESSLSAGIKVAQKNENAYALAKDRVKALNVALDELINDNLAYNKREEYLFNKANEAFANLLRKEEELTAEYGELLVKKEEIDDIIDRTCRELAFIHKSAETKTAVREGTAFEIIIGEKEQIIDYVDGVRVAQESELGVLNDNLQKIKNLLAESKNRKTQVFEEKNQTEVTVKSLIYKLNNLERLKQKLYRNQVLSATLLQDVNAIDKKISDNVDVRRSCRENIDALASARKTLVAYADKCQEKLIESEKDLLILNAEMYNLQKLDAIEYGGKCPVCASYVMEKVISPSTVKKLQSKIEELTKTGEKYRKIVTEHRTKVESIDVRLGGLTDQEKICTGYIESLESSKLTKMALMKRLYDDCGVATHEQLTSSLENVTAQVAEITTFISDVKEIASSQEHYEKVALNLTTIIDRYVNVLIPNTDKMMQKASAEYLESKKIFDNYKNAFTTGSAIGEMDEIYASEVTEDKLVAILEQNSQESARLSKRIAELEDEINKLGATTVKVDDKDYNYPQYCIRVTNEHYDEIIKEIRIAERERTLKYDELLAVNEILKTKQEEINDLKGQIKEKEIIINADKAYLKALIESTKYDDSLTQNKTYEQLEKEILSEQSLLKMQEDIALYQEKLTLLTHQEEVLSESLSLVRYTDEEIANKKNTLPLIEKDIEEIAIALADASNELTISNRISKETQKWRKNKTAYEKKTHIIEEISSLGAEEILLTEANSALEVLLPKNKIKASTGSPVCVYVDDNGIENINEHVTEELKITVGITLIASLCNVIREIIDADFWQVIRINDANVIKSDLRKKLITYAKNNGLILIFVK